MHILLVLFLIGMVVWFGIMIFELVMGVIVMIFAGLIMAIKLVYDWVTGEDE